MREFGTAGGVLAAADTVRLRRCARSQRFDHLMATVAGLMRCVLVERVCERNVLAGRDAVVDYLRSQMAFARRETLRVLYLDAAHRLIADEVASEGTVDSLAFYTREIVIRALEVGAVGLILAHNHPSGSPAATPADIAATDTLGRACAPLGILVLDHFIIAESGSQSLRAAGLLS